MGLAVVTKTFGDEIHSRAVVRIGTHTDLAGVGVEWEVVELHGAEEGHVS